MSNFKINMKCPKCNKYIHGKMWICLEMYYYNTTCRDCDNIIHFIMLRTSSFNSKTNQIEIHNQILDYNNYHNFVEQLSIYIKDNKSFLTRNDGMQNKLIDNFPKEFKSPEVELLLKLI